MRLFLSILLLITHIFATKTFAQTKKPLTHDVYDGWQSVQNSQVSPNGKYVFYTLKPQEGDATLQIQNIIATKPTTKNIQRGEQARISADSKFLIFKIKPHEDSTKHLKRKKIKEDKMPKDSLGIYALESDTLVKVSGVKSFQMPEKQGSFLAYLLEDNSPKATQLPKGEKKPLNTEKKEGKNEKIKEEKGKKEEKKGKKENKKTIENKNEKPDDENIEIKNANKKEMAEIEEIAKNEKEKNDTIKKTPLQKAEEKIKKLEEKIAEIETKNKSQKKSKPPKKESKENGSKLIFRNLLTAKQDTFLFVTQYAFDEKGTKLAFFSTGNDSSFKAGAYILDLQTQKLQQILAQAGKIQNLTFTDKGDQLAWIMHTDTTKKGEKVQIKNQKIFHWTDKQKEATQLADNSSLTPEWVIPADSRLVFSESGEKLFFTITPKPLEKDTTLLPDEIVNVDVWHWQDGKIQPQQNVDLKDDKSPNYRALLYPKTKKIVYLANLEMTTVLLTSQESDIALGISYANYEKNFAWEGQNSQADIYAISLKDGKAKLAVKGIQGGANISPQGNYFAWYSPKDSAWFAYNVKTAEMKNITKNLKNPFYDELWDMPSNPSNYGQIGWTENDEFLLVNDRYDVWQIDPNLKKPATRITSNGSAETKKKGIVSGRQQKIRFRYRRLDREEKFIKPNQLLYFHATDEETKAEGFFTLTYTKPETFAKIVWDNCSFNGLQKSKDTEKFIFTKQTFKDFPDVYVTDNTFTKITKLSNANPQQSKYLWGTVELVKWISMTGEELTGLLYKPENFDAGKKYPMITYFYERHSDDLHEYVAPTPSPSTIRASMYTSNGYVVFMPDIPYKNGQPGESAYNSVVSGVTHLIGQGFVDKDKIGIQGQSWGGYQTAYLITRTDLFAAAMAGAPVSNMTSAYGGIRWGSGNSRMSQYEKGQSRLGATLWENPSLYIENSPIFHANKVKTPLLIMHNDKDGAVPWYQGIEYFMALKRLQKPVWMLTYNEEDHNLVQRKNRKDLSIRMQQFFDYYLKFDKMPKWMKEGVPAREKGIKRRFELD